MTRILIVAPYPIIKAQHGGQKRAKALYDFYKNNYNAAKFVGVFHRGHYPEWGEDDLPLGDPAIIAEVDEHPYASELICGEAIDKDIHVRSYMARLLTEYQPTIIHLEQPFAYLGLKPLLLELGMRPLIIFGSQNIEYPLKKRIFKELKVSQELSKTLVKKTKDLEYALSQECDLLIAVNKEDADSHKEMGAKNIIIAHNGIERSVVPEADLVYWKEYKKQNKIRSIYTFIGSGHPPNWEGFLELVGADTSFIPKDCKILIAGGVSDYFNTKFTDPNDRFWSAVNTVGKLEEGRLAALIQVSDQILLPITTKRGSNLKTAEAILSRKKLVATNNTFHGFEEYEGLPNIFVGDNQEDFKQQMLNSLAATYSPLSPSQNKLAEKVQWEYCLRPIKTAVTRLLVATTVKRNVSTMRRWIRKLVLR